MDSVDQTRPLPPRDVPSDEDRDLSYGSKPTEAHVAIEGRKLSNEEIEQQSEQVELTPEQVAQDVDSLANEAQKELSNEEVQIEDARARIEARAQKLPGGQAVVAAIRERWGAIVNAAKDLGKMVGLIREASDQARSAEGKEKKESKPTGPSLEEIRNNIERFGLGQVRSNEISGFSQRAEKSVNRELFRNCKDPGAFHDALKSGAENPRWLYYILSEQARADAAYEDIPDRETAMGRLMSDTLREPYRGVSQWNGPESAKEDASRIARQLENRFYGEASTAANALLERVRSDASSEEIAILETIVAEGEAQEQAERLRYADMRRRQSECYDAILQSPNGERRREAIERRKRTEEVFEKGEMVGSLTGLDGGPYDGIGPALAEFKFGNETRKGVVKFEFADRATRAGVTPGTGPLRESAASLAYIGAGMDSVPANVARKLEGFGNSSVIELVSDGFAADILGEDPWYMSGDEPLADLHLIALIDRVTQRLDGATRNLMVRGEKVTPIDFGSELSSLPGEEPLASMPSFLLATLDSKIPIRVQEQMKQWLESPAFDAFLNALDTLPENMDAYKDEAKKRKGEVLQTFVASGETATHPAYFAPAPWQEQMHGNGFTKGFPKFVKNWKERQRAA